MTKNCEVCNNENNNNGRTCSLECKAKLISKSRTGKHYPLASIAQLGVPKSTMARQHMSAAKIGKPTWNKGMRGIYSETTLNRIRDATKKQWEDTAYRQFMEGVLSKNRAKRAYPYKDGINPTEYQTNYYKTKQERKLEYARQQTQKNKALAIGHYSPELKCIRCGYKDMRALTLDHINSDGNQHRKTRGGRTNLYVWARLNNYPNTLQVLCMNCQFIKRSENNECTKRRKYL